MNNPKVNQVHDNVKSVVKPVPFSETIQQDIMSDSDKMSEMSDRKLVNYIGNQLLKFIGQNRPYLIEVHNRFQEKTRAGKPFLGKYTNFDTFCEDYWHYTGRHIRRIISGEALPRSRKQIKALPPSREKKASSAPLSESALWTDHDFIHQAEEAIKKLLRPLESEPTRYEKVARAIAEAITGGEV